MKFEDLDLSYNILDALYDMRFESCTPIQEQTIPLILEGHDVMGVAQTGTGKTAAYLLPILSLLDDDREYPEDRRYPDDAINCVIMSPTRELAQQIDQAMQGFSYYMPEINSVAVYGGNDGNRYDQELRSLRQGAPVIIATPGRLISHLNIGNVDFSRVSFFILDEADRMLDMGFSDDILKIAKLLPQSCQTIMFSATMPDKIQELAETLLKNPKMVKLAVSKPAEKIQQSAYVCHEAQKLGIIDSLFKDNQLKRVIIFAGSKIKVKEVHRELRRMKINCGEMHSDLSQAERDETMFKFKSGITDVLVATDIVARGIDIDDIATVINFDVPHDVEDYVHRIGRTARADRDGVAMTFVSPEDIRAFMDIERFLERTITKNPLPDGLGEAPEYKFVKLERNGRGRGRKNGKRGGKHKGTKASHSKKKDSNKREDRKSSSRRAPKKSQQKEQ